MPESVLSRLPFTLYNLKAAKLSYETSNHLLEFGIQTLSLGCDLVQNMHTHGTASMSRFMAVLGCDAHKLFSGFAGVQGQAFERNFSLFKNTLFDNLKQFKQERQAELDFITLFSEQRCDQDWRVAYDDTQVILDLPSLRVIDISQSRDHLIDNYTIVFAPRAGHHSNIAERVALYLRDQGLTRMVVVEQKCADDIPLYVDGQRHSEDFISQVQQYTQVMAHARQLTGKPAHLVAICQPGPLLISALILNPQLGKTLGTAGSPMHTEAQKGFLTDFARLMGPDLVDRIMRFSGRTIDSNRIGAGREAYDGALQVLGFYYLGMDQHVRNFKHLLNDLRTGNAEAVERQKVFYDWYNTVLHFPAGFVRDTYRKIFVGNELIHGKLEIGNKRVGIKDYPGAVPVWALGGKADAIVPPLQATGHMDLIQSVPASDKLNLTCDGGHMALFRSKKVLKSHYRQIADFMLERSDRASKH